MSTHEEFEFSELEEDANTTASSEATVEVNHIDDHVDDSLEGLDLPDLPKVESKPKARPPSQWSISSYRQKSIPYTATHTWSIENFSFYDSEYIDGAEFSPQDDRDDEDLGFNWAFELVARHKPVLVEDQEFVSIYLRLYPTESAPEDLKVMATFVVYILDGNGQAKIKMGKFAKP